MKTPILASLALVLTVSADAIAQCPPSVPVEGAPPPSPVFPADNWWNVDISTAPVDLASSSFIAFVNNGGTRELHPDFGGEALPGSVDIYGMPYAVVDGTQPKKAVTFDYWDESDGVDPSTGQGCRSIRFRRRRRRSRTGSKAARRATSISAATRIAIC